MKISVRRKAVVFLRRLGRVSDDWILLASFPRGKRKILGNEVGTSIQVFDLATTFRLFSANCL